MHFEKLWHKSVVNESMMVRSKKRLIFHVCWQLVVDYVFDNFAYFVTVFMGLNLWLDLTDFSFCAAVLPWLVSNVVVHSL